MMEHQAAPRRRSLGQRLRRMLSTAEELEAEDLEERARDCGAQPIAESAPRTRVTFRGTITAVTSGADTGWLEAELSDGTGACRLVWMGHRRLEVIVPGRNLMVSGRLTQEDGQLVIYNPEFEVVS